MYFGINDNTNEIEENTYYDNVELYGIAETIQEILITSGTPPDYYALTTQTISDIPYLAMGNLNFSGTGDITAEIKSSLSEAITKCKLKFKT